jgi:hypothetical protein
MSIELRRLIEEEQARLDYEEWTESTQQSKLESLYSIRETLVHQMEMTSASWWLIHSMRLVNLIYSLRELKIMFLA